MSYERVANILNSKRIHPLFPLPKETKEDSTIAYSDHLPILAQVPLPDNQTLNIISLNILGDIS